MWWGYKVLTKWCAIDYFDYLVCLLITRRKVQSIKEILQGIDSLFRPSQTPPVTRMHLLNSVLICKPSSWCSPNVYYWDHHEDALINDLLYPPIQSQCFYIDTIYRCNPHKYSACTNFSLKFLLNKRFIVVKNPKSWQTADVEHQLYGRYQTDQRQAKFWAT